MANNSISAVVVAYNEAHMLARCLKSITFCDEIIVINLESTDNIHEVLKPFKVRIINLKKVPIVEMIHLRIKEYTKSKWVLLIDPDEEISPDLQNDLIQTLNSIEENVACVAVPWQFYFKNKVLAGTFWGGINNKKILINTEKYRFTGRVHDGGNILPDCTSAEITYTGYNVLKHYWMSSYNQLIAKHRRYLEKEGQRMYESGCRYKLKIHIIEMLKAFYFSYLIKKGYKSGSNGLFLSCFWSWYVFSSWIELFKYELLLKKNNKVLLTD